MRHLHLALAFSAFRYVSTCLPGNLHTFHDNLYEYFYEDGHSDMLAFAEDVSVTDTVYNNIFRHIDVSGATGTPVLWPNPPSSTNVYIFNNLMYDIASVNCIMCIGNNGSTYGNHRVFNNTVQTNYSQPILNCTYLQGGSLFDTNNHFIDDGSVYSTVCPNKTTTTDLVRTNAQATSDGYTSSETYAYSPTGSGSPTVGAGTNEATAYCGALTTAGLTTAATACESDTTYACTYNTSNHTVTCPARIVNTRPVSAAWDIGAYDPTSSVVQGPTNVQATAN